MVVVVAVLGDRSVADGAAATAAATAVAAAGAGAGAGVADAGENAGGRY